MFMDTIAKKQRKLTGVVTSDKMQKTRVVEVARIKTHPKYQKQIRMKTKFKAHEEKNEYKTGDTVTIGESRPLSRTKRWVILGRS